MTLDRRTFIGSVIAVVVQRGDIFGDGFDDLENSEYYCREGSSYSSSSNSYGYPSSCGSSSGAPSIICYGMDE